MLYSHPTPWVQDQCIYAMDPQVSLIMSIFQTMFKDDALSESATSKVTINDFSPEVMQKLLNFLSGKDIEISDDKDATDLFMAADKYNVAGLERFCLQKVSV
jgi:hypothetical protein